MKVAAFSVMDLDGGAARAAYRLHTGLRSSGVDSRLYVRKKSSEDSSVVPPVTQGDLLKNVLARRLDNWALRKYEGRRHLPFSNNLIPLGQLRRSADFQPDLVHLHWINAGYIGIRELGQVKTPIVWTMHDMWPFTGGCHHSEECNRYQNNCGACPQLMSRSGVDLSHKTLLEKKNHWRNNRICWVAPSRWLADRARSSAIAGNARIEVIPNGLDIRRFSPLDKMVARRLLGLPEDRRLILFGAVSATSNPWKGYEHLRKIVDVLASTNRKDVDLVIFGATANREGGVDLPVRAHYLGTLADEISMALVYSAADLFIAPSTQDNLPNTVMESMSCGTPAIAFRIGGMPDMIDDGQNGAVVDPFDCAKFAAAIAGILDKPETLLAMSSQARAKVERCFSIERVSRLYRTVYEEVVNETV